MATVNVSGISPNTTEAQLKDFFSFCGKINSIDRKGPEATVHFEKSSAARTATMLHEGTLDGATLEVTTDAVHDDHSTSKDGHDIDQTDKPRAGIAAEYLAKGYILSDKALKQAIEIDQKQGISERFLNYLKTLDTKLGEKFFGSGHTVSTKAQETAETAQARAKEVDQEKGYSKAANNYYAKALSSSYGEKVRAFYTSTAKQVQDIHEEAKRLAEVHKSQEGGETAPAAGTTVAPEAAGSAAVPDPKTQAAPTVV